MNSPRFALPREIWPIEQLLRIAAGRVQAGEVNRAAARQDGAAGAFDRRIIAIPVV